MSSGSTVRLQIVREGKQNGFPTSINNSKRWWFVCKPLQGCGEKTGWIPLLAVSKVQVSTQPCPSPVPAPHSTVRALLLRSMLLLAVSWHGLVSQLWHSPTLPAACSVQLPLLCLAAGEAQAVLPAVIAAVIQIKKKHKGIAILVTTCIQPAFGEITPCFLTRRAV